MSKSVIPATATPGETITYTLAFSNIGGLPAGGVDITDIIPVSLTNVSVVSSGVTITNTGASPAYVWTAQNLAWGDEGYITISAQISNPLAWGTFTNTATISSATSSSSDSAGVTIPTFDLSVSKTATSTTVNPTTTITYTVSVHNIGELNAAGVVISDTLPLSVTFVSSNTTNGSLYTPTTGVWNVGSVDTDTGITLTLVVTVNLVSGQTITNTALLTASTPPDTNSSNNVDSAAVSAVSGGGIYLPIIFKNVTP